MGGGDGFGVGWEDSDGFAEANVPEADSFVEGAGDDEVGAWVEVAAHDVAGVATHGFEAGAGGDVPELGGENECLLGCFEKKSEKK